MKVLNLANSSFRRVTTGVFAFIVAAALTGEAKAQTAYKVLPGSHIKVNGTSNLHDWTMLATNFSCTANVTLKADQLQDISGLNFVLPVKNLKSKEDLMDTRAYKALNAEKFNQISFKLTDAVVNAQQKSVKATGSLTISGVTNQVVIQANYTTSGDEILFKGSKSIKMSDFKIKAPSFMMGALKTGDEVVIDISLKLKN